MYRILGSIIRRNLGENETPCHKEMDIKERQLVYEYMKTIVYRNQKLLGMLSPFAELFYPTTEIKVMKMETQNRKENDQKNNTSLSKQEIDAIIIKMLQEIQKDIIYSFCHIHQNKNKRTANRRMMKKKNGLQYQKKKEILTR